MEDSVLLQCPDESSTSEYQTDDNEDTCETWYAWRRASSCQQDHSSGYHQYAQRDKPQSSLEAHPSMCWAFGTRSFITPSGASTSHSQFPDGSYEFRGRSPQTGIRAPGSHV
jgi:hypothetical protein